MATPVTPGNGTDTRKWVVTSTWGQHHVVAVNDEDAETVAEGQLEQEGYADPVNMILDGLTQEYDPEFHGAWEGEGD